MQGCGLGLQVDQNCLFGRCFQPGGPGFEQMKKEKWVFQLENLGVRMVRKSAETLELFGPDQGLRDGACHACHCWRRLWEEDLQQFQQELEVTKA